MPQFLKKMSKCVLKSRCKFITLLGDYAQQKQVGWEVIFQNTGSQSPGCVSPSGSLRAAPLTFFAACSEASGGFNCVSKVLLKSQCNKYGIWKEKIKPHLGKVCIFLPTLFYKKHNVVIKVLINTIGKKIHTLVKKHTHHAVIK